MHPFQAAAIEMVRQSAQSRQSAGRLGMARRIAFLTLFALAGPALGCVGVHRSPPKVTMEKGVGPVTKDQARAMAFRHFGWTEGSGCIQEDRGKYFFVAPPYPYIMQKDAERAGVYIDKKTGDLFTKKPSDVD
jgi:hypothetical protein